MGVRTSASSNGIIEANANFCLDLYARCRIKDGNLFFSSYSVLSALSMAYEGAKGRTAEEMRAVLHLPDEKARVRSDFRSINGELNKPHTIRGNFKEPQASYELKTANALWLQEDYPFDGAYLKVVNEWYGGNAANLDFKTKTKDSAAAINKWTEGRTNGKVKNLVSAKLLGPATRLVITNAVYFKAKWAEQFDAIYARDGKFTTGSGKSVDARMMNKLSHHMYCETSEMQMLELDYLGNEVSMLIILPKGNDISKIESVLSRERLDHWKKGMRKESVTVSLPKFRFEAKYLMAEDLKAMGMPTALNYPGSDFTGLSPTSEICISEVIHQTFIDVAEYGTEASAATAILDQATARRIEGPKTFNADHPFIFIIQHKVSGNILFFGRMSTPAP